jgi:hypothetical protein
MGDCAGNARVAGLLAAAQPRRGACLQVLVHRQVSKRMHTTLAHALGRSISVGLPERLASHGVAAEFSALRRQPRLRLPALLLSSIWCPTQAGL